MLKYAITIPEAAPVIAVAARLREKVYSLSAMHHKNLGFAWRMENTLSLSGATALLALLKNIEFLWQPFICQRMSSFMRMIIFKHMKLEYWQLI